MDTTLATPQIRTPQISTQIAKAGKAKPVKIISPRKLQITIEPSPLPPEKSGDKTYYIQIVFPKWGIIPINATKACLDFEKIGDKCIITAEIINRNYTKSEGLMCMVKPKTLARGRILFLDAKDRIIAKTKLLKFWFK